MVESMIVRISIDEQDCGTLPPSHCQIGFYAFGRSGDICVEATLFSTALKGSRGRRIILAGEYDIVVWVGSYKSRQAYVVPEPMDLSQASEEIPAKLERLLRSMTDARA